jgi:hypothetical protein
MVLGKDHHNNHNNNNDIQIIYYNHNNYSSSNNHHSNNNLIMDIIILMKVTVIHYDPLTTIRGLGPGLYKLRETILDCMRKYNIFLLRL